MESGGLNTFPVARLGPPISLVFTGSDREGVPYHGPGPSCILRLRELTSRRSLYEVQGPRYRVLEEKSEKGENRDPQGNVSLAEPGCRADAIRSKDLGRLQ